MPFFSRRQLAAGALPPIARLVAALGLSPDQLTVLGALLSVGAGAAIATGHLFAGGWLFLAGSGLDLLDGAVARLRGRVSKRGALLDSTLDRVGEAAALVGVAIWYTREAAVPEVALAGAALATSTLVSYIKARAEGLGLPAREGFFTRPERVIVLTLGLLLSPIWGDAVLAALAAIAALSAAAAASRFWAAWSHREE